MPQTTISDNVMLIVVASVMFATGATVSIAQGRMTFNTAVGYMIAFSCAIGLFIILYDDRED